MSILKYRQPTVQEIAERLAEERSLREWYRQIVRQESGIPMKVRMEVGEALYGEIFIADPFVLQVGLVGAGRKLTHKEIASYLRKREHVLETALQVMELLKNKEQSYKGAK